MMSGIVVRVFTTLTLFLYIVFAAPLLIATTDCTLASFLFTVAYEIAAFAVAIELAELLVATSLPERHHLSASNIDTAKTRVAVLYVCRDDVDSEALQALRALRDVDIFLLDDSDSSAVRTLVDSAGYHVVRRGTHAGFKAGNLNYWLALYGHSYHYFLVLDSDSVVPNRALWELVHYAEHPANSDVAIVQSSIIARPGNRFQRQVAGHALLRRRILLRLHDRIGWTLSEGHNNLHRTAALLEVNGFDTSASCEDTIVSLRLTSRGWRIIRVDTQTFDAEPNNVFVYRRRSVRWTRQTVDAILAVRGRVGIRLIVLLARHLIAHLLPTIWLTMLGLLVVTMLASNSAAFIGGIMWFEAMPWLRISLTSLWGGVLTLIALRLYCWQREGGTLSGFLSFTLISGAVASFSSMHTTLGLLRSFLIDQTKFVPTGSKRADDVHIVPVWRGMAGPWFLAAFGLGSQLLNRTGAGGLMVALPLAVGVSAPLVLSWFHHDQVERA